MYLVYKILDIDDPTIKPDDSGMPQPGGNPKNFFGDFDLLKKHVAVREKAEVANGARVAENRLPSSADRDIAIALAPARTSAALIIAPMPFAPPVTRVVLPSTEKSSSTTCDMVATSARQAATSGRSKILPGLGMPFGSSRRLPSAPRYSMQSSSRTYRSSRSTVPSCRGPPTSPRL
jgi:hypothetical protein